MTEGMKWVTFTKRTDDPKLRYIEHRLALMGIPYRRNGYSWHAPILEVPELFEDRAWNLLSEKIGNRTLDEIPDDDRLFKEYK